MPTPIAVLVFALIVAYLFWQESKRDYDDVSKSIWIPFIWMAIAGSRYVSHWLEFTGLPQPNASYMEGSPIDRFIFLILIVSGAISLMRRNMDWATVLSKNPWVWLFFLYGFISIGWSDFPFIAFKRLVKSMGNIIIALLILAEERPFVAVGLILRRLAYLLVPLSILFIKYIPEMGRSYHMGYPMFTGVSSTKNGLGALCLLSGLYFGWNLLIERRYDAQDRNPELSFSEYAIILPMLAYLFYKSDSATSILCMLIAVGAMIIARSQWAFQQPSTIFYTGFTLLALFFTFEWAFDLTGGIIAAMGRDTTLTTRVPMWGDLLELVKYPFIGFGFESFWLGWRQHIIEQNWSISHNAHNGYLEMYLNLGLIGLFFLAAWYLSGLLKAARLLSSDYTGAVLKICIIVVIAFYNFTEATFYGVSNFWTIFMFAIMTIHDEDNVASKIPDKR